MKRLTLALLLLCASLFAHADTFSSFTTRVNTESSKYSYRVQVANASVAATATDVLTLCGSATKTVRVTQIAASADATAASVIDFYLLKRTVVNTAGTSAAQTAVKNDTNDPTPSASVKLYSANPSALGAGVLFLGDHYALAAAATPAFPVARWVADLGTRNDKTLVLRGVAECLAFNLNGQTIPAGFLLHLNVAWTEE